MISLWLTCGCRANLTERLTHMEVSWTMVCSRLDLPWNSRISREPLSLPNHPLSLLQTMWETHQEHTRIGVKPLARLTVRSLESCRDPLWLRWLICIRGIVIKRAR